MAEERLIDIETRLAYQDQTINELNEALANQQQSIMKLERLCASLTERVAALVDAAPGSAANDMSFLMPEPNGRRAEGASEISYRVLSESGSGQIIEVVESSNDGDSTIWSRYEANRSSVSPISSRNASA